MLIVFHCCLLFVVGCVTFVVVWLFVVCCLLLRAACCSLVVWLFVGSCCVFLVCLFVVVY